MRRRARYLQDLNRLIAPRLIPDAPLRRDTLAAPYAGRRADEVGEWYLVHRCGVRVRFRARPAANTPPACCPGRLRIAAARCSAALEAGRAAWRSVFGAAPQPAPRAPLVAASAGPKTARQADAARRRAARRRDLERIAPQWMALSPVVRRFFTVDHPEVTRARPGPARPPRAGAPAAGRTRCCLGCGFAAHPAAGGRAGGSAYREGVAAAERLGGAMRIGFSAVGPPQ